MAFSKVVSETTDSLHVWQRWATTAVAFSDSVIADTKDVGSDALPGVSWRKRSANVLCSISEAATFSTGAQFWISCRRNKCRADWGVGDQDRIDSTILHSSTASCLFCDQDCDTISQKWAFDWKENAYLSVLMGTKWKILVTCINMLANMHCFLVIKNKDG